MIGVIFRGLYGVQSVSGMSERLGSGVHLVMHRLGFVTVKISPSCPPRQRGMRAKECNNSLGAPALVL